MLDDFDLAYLEERFVDEATAELAARWSAGRLPDRDLIDPEEEVSDW